MRNQSKWKYKGNCAHGEARCARCALCTGNKYNENDLLMSLIPAHRSIMKEYNTNFLFSFSPLLFLAHISLNFSAHFSGDWVSVNLPIVVCTCLMQTMHPATNHQTMSGHALAWCSADALNQPTHYLQKWFIFLPLSARVFETLARNTDRIPNPLGIRANAQIVHSPCHSNSDLFDAVSGFVLLWLQRSISYILCRMVLLLLLLVLISPSIRSPEKPENQVQSRAKIQRIEEPN